MNAEVLDFSMDNENKNLALEGAISQIEKNFGKGSVMKLGKMIKILIFNQFLQDHLG